MTCEVVIARNPLEPDTWETFETEDLTGLLQEQFPAWPDSARIYRGQVAQCNDVTPSDPRSIQELRELEGRVYVVVYPRDPLTIILAVVAVVAVVAVAFLIKIPDMSQRNTQAQSPNNELAERTNRARPGGRIPDIFGKVRSTPDLLTAPYKVFKDIGGEHREVEVAFFCIGRGKYEIHDVRDDTTPLGTIEGSSVEIYDPGTSPLSGSPAMTVGDPITETLVTARRANSVNGQTLEPSDGGASVNADCEFVYPDTVIAGDQTVGTNPITGLPYTVSTDFAAYFSPGDQVTISTAAYSGVDLAGIYTVATVSGNTMTLSSPATVNSDWGAPLNALPGSHVPSQYSSITSGGGWVGPFVLDLATTTSVYANFVCSQGAFKDDGKNQYPANVGVELELTPCDTAGSPIGPAETFTSTIIGSGTSRQTRAVTLRATPTFTGRCLARARRTTPKDTDFEGTVVDETKWRDCYAIAPAGTGDFDDVTTAFAVTLGTDAALAVKERKLNMLVTRQVPTRIGTTSTFTTTLSSSRSAADIFCAVALDPKIGNRPVAELDVAGIYQAVQDVRDYFGTDDCAEFCYTFDKTDLTAEETMAMIAQATFCTAYRRGSVISLKFERPTTTSRLLLNHRNKTPNSETRTVSFGVSEGYDGVAMDYVDPEDDAVVTLYIPQLEPSAAKAKKIETAGIRNRNQAWMHAWRAWNKLKFQRTTLEVTAHQEADLLVITDRLTVADNTRSETQDGEVVGQTGLLLELSQPAPMSEFAEHAAHLQMPDGTVEVIACTPGPNEDEIVLASAPSLPLVTEDEKYARTTYVITSSTGARTAEPFLLAEKDPQEDFTVRLKAINYDIRYYNNDRDYINGLVDRPPTPTPTRTFGVMSGADGQVTNGAADREVLYRYTLATPMLVTGLSIDLGNSPVGTDGNFRLTLRRNVSGAPEELLAVTPTYYGETTVGGVLDFDVTPIALAAGDYWLGIHMGGEAVEVDTKAGAAVAMGTLSDAFSDGTAVFPGAFSPAVDTDALLIWARGS